MLGNNINSTLHFKIFTTMTYHEFILHNINIDIIFIESYDRRI